MNFIIMKRQFYNVFMFAVVFGLINITACKGGPKDAPKEVVEEKEQPIDYKALVSQEFPPFETFESIVKGFQEKTEKLMPTNEVWAESEKAVKQSYEPKGFVISNKEEVTDGFFIKATKNGEISRDPSTFVFSFKPAKTDSLAAAVLFVPMGDMYVMGKILLADSCIYNVMVENIKNAGYKQSEMDGEKNIYRKERYFFNCDKNTLSLELHYDFNSITF